MTSYPCPLEHTKARTSSAKLHPVLVDEVNDKHQLLHGSKINGFKIWLHEPLYRIRVDEGVFRTEF